MKKEISKAILGALIPSFFIFASCATKPKKIADTNWTEVRRYEERIPQEPVKTMVAKYKIILKSPAKEPQLEILKEIYEGIAYKEVVILKADYQGIEKFKQGWPAKLEEKQVHKTEQIDKKESVIKIESPKLIKSEKASNADVRFSINGKILDTKSSPEGRLSVPYPDNFSSSSINLVKVSLVSNLQNNSVPKESINSLISTAGHKYKLEISIKSLVNGQNVQNGEYHFEISGWQIDCDYVRLLIHDFPCGEIKQ